MNVFDTLQQSKKLPDVYRQMTRVELEERIRQHKERLRKKLLMLGHHYQRDEVFQFADQTGDSLQLAQMAAKEKEAQFIVFCGVHFMAETADLLTSEEQTVLLPDLRAGCSMADMADIHQTERAWERLQLMFGDTILPLTYVNSTAAIKAFCGRNGGATVTSSNAKKMLEWAFTQKERLLFLPDQHLGRNTAYELGIPLEAMAVWNPETERLETDQPLENIRVILWKGHCSVHEKFTVKHIEHLRKNEPDMSIIVHPECTHDVVIHADDAGSTHYIIKTIESADSGTKWAVGTEMNLVNRLANEHPDKEIVSLNPTMCPCLTMNRIDIEHLCWSLDQLAEGVFQHPIKVEDKDRGPALLALQRMLDRA
jgi:quinolinate synthase